MMKFPLVLAVVFALLLLVSQDVAVADNRKLTGAYDERGNPCADSYGCGFRPPDGSYTPGYDGSGGGDGGNGGGGR